MTNAQKWVAAFLGLFLILFLLGRITRKEEKTMPPSTGQMGQQTTQTSENADGQTLTKQLGCISCHGDNLQGTQMAPAIENVSKNWTRDGLINYLRNPASYSGGARFDEYREKYKSKMMPSFGNRDVKELGRITDFLLTK
jgi:cytochrome c2